MVLIFKIKFSVSFQGSTHQRYKFKIWVKSVKPFGCRKQFCILQLPISYCVSLIIYDYGYHTRHVFIDFFQMKCFSAVKFYMGYEKNMNFHVILNFPKILKKVEKIGLGSFNCIIAIID